MSKLPFERVVCITLDRRDDRWERFLKDLPEDWPFGEVEKYPAIDGKKTRVPPWWRQGRGAWGCYRSHVNLIEDCLNRDIHSLLLLEDDAICVRDFTAKWERFHRDLPHDWQILYLGGQHLMMRKHKPRRVTDEVYIPYNVNRTHAWAVNTEAGMQRVYQWLTNTKEWRNRHHIDHHMGRIIQRRDRPCYCPKEWLIGQNDTKSNISGKRPPIRFWAPAGEAKPMSQPFVVILGLHRSGSSCLAGVLHELGVHLGNVFTGHEANGGYEAKDLATACEKAMRFPGKRMNWNVMTFQSNIERWVRARSDEAAHMNTMAGAKYPHLCVYARSFAQMLGENLRVIHIDRPLEDSIESLIKREHKGRTFKNKASDDQLADLQRFLDGMKRDFMEDWDGEVLEIQFYDLLKDPRGEIDAVCDYLSEVKVPTGARDKAVLYVDASKPTTRSPGTADRD
jgi:hypothetical protein